MKRHLNWIVSNGLFQCSRLVVSLRIFYCDIYIFSRIKWFWKLILSLIVRVSLLYNTFTSGVYKTCPCYYRITIFLGTENKVMTMFRATCLATKFQESLQEKTRFRCSVPNCTKLSLGADHLTFEGGGWMISGQQAFFFLATWWAGYFFSF